MPRRNDLKKILVIGSGPIQIGQACEFDYSGSQALRALQKEGFEVVLVNSNPATIMTDPQMSSRTYIEALVPETLEKVIAKERPDALLPTLGGQVALNLALDLDRMGVLQTYGVQLIGVRLESISLAEDRERFRDLLIRNDLPCLKSRLVRSEQEALQALSEFAFPLILRPNYTLGGAGGGIVYNQQDFVRQMQEALKASPTSEVLIEESIIGWKELEYEVMADSKNQFVVICSIENLDPMGVHTGDSMTVAPAQTLTDKEHQRLREASKKICLAVGIETGGCNIQFALDPLSDRFVVVEMNPRVSRSSALASKATGYPIAKISALLAVGYHLDELKNDITGITSACFEPALDYVVLKIPRFNFEKFSQTQPVLGTQMKSVGEAMALGRTFREAWMRAFHSLETDQPGLELPSDWQASELSLENVRSPRYDRWYLMAELLRSKKAGVQQLQEATGIDPWFLKHLDELISLEGELKTHALSPVLLRKAKTAGLSDEQIAGWCKKTELQIFRLRKQWKIDSELNQVDTCAGEFEAQTPYYYFSYEDFPMESGRAQKPAPLKASTKKDFVVVLGSGPNRIGQGIEFDYCCVKAVQSIRKMGLEAVMINCNPETVSTDYDISNRLYFEPLTAEFVRRVIAEEKKSGRCIGILCQTGGQTALKLSQELKEETLLGTSRDQIDRAEDRDRFYRMLQKLKIKRPPSITVKSIKSLRAAVKKMGFPILLRPSYVLGGRAMHILRSPLEFEALFDSIRRLKKSYWPMIVDRFLEDAIEVDVDCVGDGKRVQIASIMEHIEEAGIHSGDSSCVIPPQSLASSVLKKIENLSISVAKELKLSGFLNLQLAITDSEIFVLEVNPRASRTIPFVCKATGIDWIELAIRAMLGERIDHQLKSIDLKPPSLVSVKQVVFPFLKFPGVDVLLGPEMKSTGEVMAVGSSFEEAFVKGLLSSNHRLSKDGSAFVSVKDSDKPKVVKLCRELKRLGYRIVCTHGTARYLQSKGIVCSGINKVKEGRPHIVDAIINREIQLLVNTTDGIEAISDSFSIRRSALQAGIPYFTNLMAAQAAIFSLQRWIQGGLEVHCLQDFHRIRPNGQRMRSRSTGSPPALSERKALQKLPRRR
ncbi:MAG: carbamoyl-phosphate synthase large subunit [Bradymonadales bacterium]|nr:MAG: carbamoyl-phosphate synthase large subunit [Bradymonadales bacterium]